MRDMSQCLEGEGQPRGRVLIPCAYTRRAVPIAVCHRLDDLSGGESLHVY